MKLPRKSACRGPIPLSRRFDVMSHIGSSKKLDEKTGLLSAIDPVDTAVSVPSHKESHLSGGDLIKSIVYGGLDAVINSESTVAAVFGARIVLACVGCSNPWRCPLCRRPPFVARRPDPWHCKPHRGRYCDGPGRLHLVQGRV